MINEKYKLKTIFNSKLYCNKMTIKLASLYYLIFLQNYKKSKIMWESALVIIYLKNIISFFY